MTSDLAEINRTAIGLVQATGGPVPERTSAYYIESLRDEEGLDPWRVALVLAVWLRRAWEESPEGFDAMMAALVNEMNS